MDSQDLLVPLQGVQVHQHGAGGVGDVGDVHAAVDAAGEVPDDPGVHGAEEDVAAPRRARAGPRRCRAASGSWGRRSRRPAAGRSRGGSGPGRRCGRAPCTARRCGCPARRWRCARARRCSCPTAAVVSRWLVMPMALTSSRVMPAFSMAPATTSWTLVQISAASCSTQPGFGKICSCSFWSTETIRPSRSKTMQRLEVVPWSMAAMNGPWRCGRRSLCAPGSPW